MIFYITGPDTYRGKEKLNELKAKFLREVDPTGLSVLRVDGITLTPASLGHVFDTASLFARRRFIVVSDALKNKDKAIGPAIAKLLAGHAKPADKKSAKGETGEENLIVFFEDAPPTAKHALHTWLMANAYAQPFPFLVGRVLEQWVIGECKKSDHEIEPAAIRLLLERTGTDTWSLSQDIARLVSYAELSAPITTTDVEALVHAGAEAEIFPLIDAMLASDLSRSAPMLVSYLGQGENAQSLIALLETQFRTLILLSEDARAVPSGVHPFVIKKLTPLAKRHRPNDFKRAYERLSELDRELKTTAFDPTTLFLRFLLSLAKQSV